MKRNFRIVFINIFLILLLAGEIAMQPAHASAESHEGVATVQMIDPDKGIARLAHAPIASLNWPAMTMNFRVGEHVRTQGIKANDKVIFTFMQTEWRICHHGDSTCSIDNADNP